MSRALFPAPAARHEFQIRCNKRLKVETQQNVQFETQHLLQSHCFLPRLVFEAEEFIVALALPQCLNNVFLRYLGAESVSHLIFVRRERRSK